MICYLYLDQWNLKPSVKLVKFLSFFKISACIFLVSHTSEFTEERENVVLSWLSSSISQILIGCNLIVFVRHEGHLNESSLIPMCCVDFMLVIVDIDVQKCWTFSTLWSVWLIGIVWNDLCLYFISQSQRQSRSR